jgi:hypothetical protein
MMPSRAQRWRSLASQIDAAMDLRNVPWNLLLSAAAGAWLMASPAAFGTAGAAADSDYLAGALAITGARLRSAR